MRYILIFLSIGIAVVFLGVLGTLFFSSVPLYESQLPLYEPVTGVQVPSPESSSDVAEVIPYEEVSDFLRPELVEDSTATPLPSETTLLFGEASGIWFFEGSMVVEIRSTEGALLDTRIAHVTSETWMTTDPVSFDVPFEASVYAGQTITLVFKKDNPSGFVELDDTETIVLTIAE